MANENLARRLQSGLSVFGWYTKIENGEFSVHVDLNFDTGKFGGSSDDKVQFELDFKRVEVIVFCGDRVEPIKSSIARTLSLDSATAKIIQETRAESGASGGLSINEVAIPKVELAVSGKVSKTTVSTVERIQSAATIAVRHLLTENLHPTWDIRSVDGGELTGAPWDPVHEPRFRFNFSVDRNEPYPHLKVVVKCRSEDLILKSIKIKDETQQLRWRKNRAPDANRIAAEQYLKSLIEKEGLPLPNISHPYGDVVVADVILTVE
ncbi:hypothetical protein [Paracoccus sanguinis]|uniref:hypothetical protein n=1 Tax=Paracoccus sanguinis TaxID=1545044 RepID=UPI0012E00955|nr:hypothetical protein [Paracoccus sanguinis]